jgi:4-hydroxybenzoate polyprenyltransferase
MRWLLATITIIRLPNLVFIFLTQVLVYYCLILPALDPQQTLINGSKPILLALSTTLIAMAGYIINDYFDVKIDEINKPKRVTVELQFKRRWVMGAHIVLNIIAVLIAIPIALKSGHLSLIGIQLLCIIYLIAYSAQLKREAITGNLCIAVLTTLLVLTPALYEYFYFKEMAFGRFHVYFFILLFFAFAITWLREIAKDLEDLKGDAIDGCNTMPIKYGIRVAKYWMFGITLMLLVVAILQVLLMQNSYLYNASLLLLVILPLFYLLFKIRQSKRTVDFKQLSNLIKGITFAGILSIYFIK